jgi:hypothetical protein
MELIDRILAALNANVDIQDIHANIMGGPNPPSEYEFFLAFKGAEQLLGTDQNAPITQRL